MKLSPRYELLQNQLSKRILVMDGAMGTAIQALDFEEADYRGERFKDHPVDLKGNYDILILSLPDAIKGIHLDYLNAGSDIIGTNTFTANGVSQSDFKTEDLVYEVNYEAAKVAKSAVDEVMEKDPSKPRFVAGSIGPTTRAASLSHLHHPNGDYWRQAPV